MGELRERLGLNMREVYRTSKEITKSLRNSDCVVSSSRLSDIEGKGHTPEPVPLTRSVAGVRL